MKKELAFKGSLFLIAALIMGIAVSNAGAYELLNCDDAGSAATPPSTQRKVILDNFNAGTIHVNAANAPGAPRHLSAVCAAAGEPSNGAEKKGAGSESGLFSNLGLTVDNGTFGTNIGYGGTGADHFMAFNRFTPDPASVPFALTNVEIYWDSGQVAVGDQYRVVILTDADGDGNPVNALIVHEQAVTVGVVDGWQNIPLSTPLLLAGPGDVIIGFAQDSDSPYPFAADDGTSYNGRSWVADWSADCVNGPLLCPVPITWPPSCTLTTLDTYGLNNNWLIRGVGYTPPPPFMSLGASSFTDACLYGCNGNDGFADPGETITFTLPVHNIGFADATNVVATLTSAYPITGTAALGTLAAGATANAVFVFDIPLSAPCGTLIPFTITVTATEEPYTWSFQDSIRVGDWTLGATVEVFSDSFETWPLTQWTLGSTGGI